MIKEIIAKSALSKHKNAFPTLWDLNPYRGCNIGCKYCFAQYSHQYLGLSDYFKEIIVKTNIAEQLFQELQKRSWKKEQIKLGGIADVYQPIEKKYALMPKIIDVLKKTKTPVFIQTKSTLMYRDLELIKELSKVTTVDISVSISSFDENIRKIIEPNAAPSIERMKLLHDFKGICRKTIVSFMPIIPLISDTDENLEMAFKLTKELDLDVIMAYPLHLRNKTKFAFFELIRRNFPNIYNEFIALYKTSNLKNEYAENLREKIAKLQKKYSLNNSYSIITKPVENTQLTLF